MYNIYFINRLQRIGIKTKKFPIKIRLLNLGSWTMRRTAIKDLYPRFVILSAPFRTILPLLPLIHSQPAHITQHGIGKQQHFVFLPHQHGVAIGPVVLITESVLPLELPRLMLPLVPSGITRVYSKVGLLVLLRCYSCALEAPFALKVCE